MSKISNLLASVLLVTNVYGADIWKNSSDYGPTIENAINQNFKKKVKRCIDFNRDLSTLIISDKFAWEMSSEELLIILNYNKFNDGYIDSISDRISKILPDIWKWCEADVLKNIDLIIE